MSIDLHVLYNEIDAILREPMLPAIAMHASYNKCNRDGATPANIGGTTVHAAEALDVASR